MRQEHETAKSFNELKAITEAIMLKKGEPTNATHQTSEPTQEANNANAKAHTPKRMQEARTQTSENANISDLTQKTGSKPKTSVQAKKGALNPTKKAFSERQKTTIRDNAQTSDNKRLKTEQASNSNLRAKPSGEALAGLATHQEKGGSDE
ncbi:hypothetical protein C2R92_01455 [Helicobacter pylori]|uniref:Hac prophage II protein n=1 Tax=Helicobacter pylori TaxID=210 RepID=A0A2T6SXG3_HELPX|nr:hypothetical protein [Helicobacter pylori]PUD42719.1 hypothetical protein C2R92_01455 [Helicobacter pylori]